MKSGRNAGSLTENVSAMFLFSPCSAGFGGNSDSRRRRVTEKGERTRVRGEKGGKGGGKGEKLKKGI